MVTSLCLHFRTQDILHPHSRANKESHSFVSMCAQRPAFNAFAVMIHSIKKKK